MSALGQKRRSAHVRVMSPLPPKANIAERPFDLLPPLVQCDLSIRNICDRQIGVAGTFLQK